MDAPWGLQQVIDAGGHVCIESWVEVGEHQSLDAQVLFDSVASLLLLFNSIIIPNLVLLLEDLPHFYAKLSPVLVLVQLAPLEPDFVSDLLVWKMFKELGSVSLNRQQTMVLDDDLHKLRQHLLVDLLESRMQRDSQLHDA